MLYVAKESFCGPKVSSARLAAYRKLPETWTSAALEPFGALLPSAYVDSVCVLVRVRQPSSGYSAVQAETELPSSFTVYRRWPSVEPAVGAHQAPWRGPSPGSALPGSQAVRLPVSASMLKMRIKSAPRSGTIRYFPVGSSWAACG